MNSLRNVASFGDPRALASRLLEASASRLVALALASRLEASALASRLVDLAKASCLVGLAKVSWLAQRQPAT
jgi:hypothetical protein